MLVWGAKTCYKFGMTQADALSILKTGGNVFLTGEPGSGKTHTVNEYVRYLRSRKVEPSITASTGIAATHIGGYTIHSWSGIGIKRSLDKYTLDRIASNERILKRVQKARVLIIDEVSMLGPETLDMVDAVCRTIKQSREPFGGLQVVLVGDFFQLPPVVKASVEEADDAQDSFTPRPPARFAYQSSAWQRAKFLTCYLSEQYRQDDLTFLSLLSAIRRNEFDEEHFAHLEKRSITREKIPENIPQLYSHNVDVDRVNHVKLERLKGDTREFEMESEGPEHLVASLVRGCLSPETLALKPGAAVMCTKNNIKEKFVNGTLGTVSGFDKTNGYPLIRTHGGRSILIEPMDWTVEENGQIKARVRQVPLRLSWAITVHKSQGQSLDAAVMDLSQVFEFGQGYVALSRVRRLAGVHLLGWNEQAFQVHPEVLSTDGEFHVASDEAQEVFAKIGEKELATMHSNFIRAVGGLFGQAGKKVASSDGFSKIRETYPSAYRPWSKEDDVKLHDTFINGNNNLAHLAKLFGRKNGAIKSRLVKLGLIAGGM